MKKHRTTVYLIISLIVTLFASADSGHLFTSDKLSSSLINCICQDKYGYIWVGTDYGLSRFDGYRFTNYHHASEDTTSLVDNTVQDLFVDSKGNLWIGGSKGFMRYDYGNDNFVRYNFVDSAGITPRIYSIIENHQGEILVGTAGYGLHYVKPGTNELLMKRKYSNRQEDLFYRHTYDDGRGNLWRSSHLSTFSRYTETNGNVQIHNYNSPVGPPMAFFGYGRNSMLIVCMTGLLYYDYDTDAIRMADFDLGPFKGNISINCATRDHLGNIYIGTADNGMLMIPRGSRKLIPTESRNNERFSLNTSNVYDIMEDKDHNLWVGCYKKGLYLINQRSEAFHSWKFSAQNYTIGSSVSSIAAGDNGDTWCTVQNSGVFCFDKNGEITTHPKSPTGTRLIYRDHEGQYWISNSNTLYSYNPATGASQSKMKCDGAGIFCMADDGAGSLFISSYSKGLYVYDTKNDKVKVYSMYDKAPHGHLSNDWIRHLLFDRSGLLWIATSNGVSCMDTKNGRFDVFGWDRLLKDIQVNYLCNDVNGDIIIGTDAGLYIYRRHKNVTEVFPHSEQLRDKQICGIVRDKDGALWISTTMGIWQYDNKKKQFIGHINGNGLASHEYAQGAVLHTGNDMIGFGISDGITTFYPNDVKNSIMAMGDVFLTGFIIDGKSIDCRKSDFEIPYSKNSFTMEFSLLNYRNTDNITFQYRINGGKNWTPIAEGTNAISFNKMKPGRYVIQVRAANNGTFSKGIKTITVIVDDPWYSSTLAYFIYCLMIAAIILFGVTFYERRRREELDEAKMRFLINATHDIRSPLTLIMGPLNKLKSRLTDDESKADVDTIDRNAQRLLLLVNQILDERKIDKNQMKLHCSKTDLVKFVSGICTLYNYNAHQRNINFSFVHEDDELMVWIDRINFDKVISNLLSNAFKYTFDGGDIVIRLSHDDRNAIITVEDTGIGFKDEKTDKLFDRFYQGANSGGFHIEGTGIGLNLCKAIISMHGGKIKALNRTDGKKGAQFVASIPLGNSHLKPEEIVKDEDETEPKNSAVKKQASKNYRILVVDDDVEIAHYIKNELSNWYRFDTFSNGKEALKALLTGSYHLVISDVMMPEMDGITLLKKIKSNTNISDIPVILLTSKSEVSDRLDGFKKGADAFLAKPFNMEELHILIDNLINNVRRLRGKFSGAQEQEDKIEKVEVVGNNDSLMDRIMKVINTNLSDPDFNVEKLTEDVGISRAQLHRKMKEIAGISTGEFIRNLRLEQAARLIVEDKINVTQVAYAVGFNNQTHFSTVFKKHFGLSPSEYAEQKTGKKKAPAKKKQSGGQRNEGEAADNGGAEDGE
jgi:signal transduction histidine kinase/ligand-binding sensor domain-containing protein/DNA-binding response OmpR family regulator